LFSGGLGGTQGRALGEDGREEVREFVRGGGGYLGICAGAYLALEGASWDLGLLDAKVVSPKWERGRATLAMELTARGKEILGDAEGPLSILYHNGPVVRRAGDEESERYEPLAYFREEVAGNG